MLTAERLREVLSYDGESGKFTWLVPRGSMSAGDVAGCPNDKGHIYIGIDKVIYPAHRLAWLYITGEWPSEIDHIDLNKANNAWENLRQCTRAQNISNTPKSKRNRSGFKGVYKKKNNGKWCAQIRAHGRSFHLGYFDDPEEAHAEYVAASVKYYGEFARAA